MIVLFDKQKMHVQVVVGTLETYTPSEKIKELQSKVDEARAKMQEFMNTVLNPALAEIDSIVEEVNKPYSPPKEKG